MRNKPYPLNNSPQIYNLKDLISYCANEYKDKTLPHYSLYKELNTKYINPGKRDPGTNFMQELRKRI